MGRHSQCKSYHILKDAEYDERRKMNLSVRQHIKIVQCEKSRRHEDDHEAAGEKWSNGGRQ